MQRSSIPLGALRTFEVVVRHGSIGAAAIELHVTHGAVSKQIRQLEQWLGQELFARSGRQMTPTVHGIAFAQEIGSAFGLIDQACKSYGRLTAKQTLHVRAPATFAMRWLIPRLPQFYERHPNTEVHVTTTMTIWSPERSVCDIVIQRGDTPHLRFQGLTLFHEDNSAIISPDVAKLLEIKEPHDILKANHLATETRPFDWRNWLEAAGVHGTYPNILHRFDHQFIALQATIDGLGAMIGPVRVVADDIRKGRLCVPFLDVVAKGATPQSPSTIKKARFAVDSCGGSRRLHLKTRARRQALLRISDRTAYLASTG